ncbi:tRNA pseudouridine(38/39) synthase [Armadillidium vulgare]|nr:tRNA pseudouridine(38/39) synthase [Armadillidium vulgare]
MIFNLEFDLEICGRTDKGVSAFSQVISITLRSKLKEEEKDELHLELDYSQILNRVLPLDVRVLAWSPIEEGFSARFDCVSRVYKYFFPLGSLNLEYLSFVVDE